MLTKLNVMASMQFATNAMVSGADWFTGNNDYLLAAGMESVEIIDGVGWKWWKHTERADATQLHLELVDIWHFMLGEAIREFGGDIERTAAYLEETWRRSDPVDIPTVKKLKLFAASCFEEKLNVVSFVGICNDFDLSFDALYKLYIIKNTLVKFRNDHGYNTDQYIKEWDDKEDNVHLIEQADLLDDSHPEFVEHLYDALVKIYPGNPLVGA